MNHRPFLKSILVFCISLAGLLCSLKGYTQATGNPIVDAPKLKIAIDSLKSRPDPTRAKLVFELIKANSSVPFDDYDAMRKYLNNNKVVFKYLDSLLEKIPVENAKDIKSTSEKLLESNAQPQASNPMGIMAIDALGTFIAERFKQELEIAFLQRFKAWLEDKTNVSQALQLLLPESRNVLLQNEPYQYTVFLETLKESFRKDLTNIPVNIGVYLGNDPFNLAQESQYYFTSLLIYNNIVQIIKGQPIIEALMKLDQDSLMSRIPANFQSIIHFFSLTSQLLDNPDNNAEGWLDISKIKSSLNKPENIKIFTELLLLKYGTQLEKIRISNDLTLSQIIISNKNNIAFVLDWITELTQTYFMIQKNYGTIRDAIDANKDIPGDAILGLQNSIIVTFRTFFTLKKLNIKIDPFIESRFESFAIKINSFTELLVNIKEKNYGLALTKVIDMLSTFIKNPTVINLVKKYGNFAVSVAKADNKNDMLAALRTAALPVGSYRIKRNAFTNISLNAYAGIGGGLQTFSSDVPAGIEKTNTVLGFTAPVGLAYSWGYKKTRDSLNESSGTIFLSMLDIGAVTAFRLTKDETETLPELKWSNLLAPGIYYVHGFKKSPISAGLGVQYGPEVRNIKDNSPVVLPAAWSARLFLAVDIPVFNFYSRTEKKKMK